MRGLWPVAVVVAVFAGLGLAGALRPSPGDSDAARADQARFDALPMELGGWRGVATAVPEKHLRIAEADAHLSRAYTKGAERVALLILAGAPGPLGAHTPETCFAAAGYEPEGAAVRRPLPNDFGALWAGNFSPPASRGASCRVAWGWGDGRAWAAPDDPRISLGGRNRVYKLYVSRPSGLANGPDPSVCDFLAAFLPAFAAH